jgi:hypothetical protein
MSGTPAPDVVVLLPGSWLVVVFSDVEEHVPDDPGEAAEAENDQTDFAFEQVGDDAQAEMDRRGALMPCFLSMIALDTLNGGRILPCARCRRKWSGFPVSPPHRRCAFCRPRDPGSASPSVLSAECWVLSAEERVLRMIASAFPSA